LGFLSFNDPNVFANFPGSGRSSGDNQNCAATDRKPISVNEAVDSVRELMDETKVPPTNSQALGDRPILRIPSAIRIAYQLASGISPMLGAAMAQLLLTRPPHARYRQKQHAVLSTAQRVVLKVRNQLVRAYEWGAGPSVLLVHGWGGHAGQMTEFVAPLTAANYRVIAVDAPAHGRSAGQLSSLVHFSDAIAMAACAFGPFHAVVAHSLGAAATAYQMSKGMTVDRAVFIAPPARQTGIWQLFRQTLGMSDQVWELMRVRTERWLKVDFDDLHPDVVAPHMRTPLLVLHGENDRVTPHSEGQTLARVWPGARFCPLDCSHLGILSDMRTLVKTVEFVRQ
jgi:pimeloyl-ACP methyl ester carboxylesterase